MTEFIITSTVLILIVIMLRHFIKGKIILRLQYAIWTLVLIKLLIPVSFFSSPISLMNAVQKTSAYSYAEKALEDTRIYSDYISNTELTPDEASEVGRGTLHEIRGYARGSGYEHLRSYIFMDSLSVVLERVIKMIWYVGAVTVGAILLLSNLSFARKLKKTRRIFPADGCRLPVYIVDALASPCMFGFLRPVIYITPDVSGDAMKLRHVLAHEQTHYRHGDHIWSALRGLCLAVHWYNPLVWMAATFSRRDAELACDEGTIGQLGEASRIEYGRTLIGLTCEKRTAMDLLCCATTMTDGKEGIKERVTLIAKKPKVILPVTVAAALIAVVAFACTFTGATAEISETIGDTNVPIRVEAEGDFPEALLDYATEYVAQQVDSYNEVGKEAGLVGDREYTIIDAKITGLTMIDTGTDGLTSGINMYLLEYRLRPDHPENVVLAGGMRMERIGDEDWITEWGSSGQPYLLMAWDGSGAETTWQRICATTTLTIQEEYNSPEMHEKYGNMFTAAAMELYRKNLEINH